MAIDIAQPMSFTVDLATGLTEQPQRAHLRYGNKNANRIVVKVTNDGKDADLTGVSASGVFYRPPDGDEVPLTGSVIGSEVSVLLNDHCYTQEGHYTADVKLLIGDVVRTILTISGYVRRDGSGVLIDVENVIPSLEELLAQLQNLKDTTDRANAAADRVEALTIDASGLAGDANKLGGKPPEAYSAVNLLGNSNFRIAQAGYGGMHGAVRYVCDRWYNPFGFGEFSFDELNGLTVTYKTNHAYVCQKIANAHLLVGKPLTFAVCFSDGSIFTCSGVYSQTTATAINEKDNWIIGIYEGEVRLVVVTGSVTVKWAALYEGAYTAETLPPDVPKGYAAELAECQRYYQEIPFDISSDKFNTTPDYPHRIPIVYPAEMRIIPTASLSEYWNSAIGSIAVTYVTAKSLAVAITCTQDGVFAEWHGKIVLNADL